MRIVDPQTPFFWSFHRGHGTAIPQGGTFDYYLVRRPLLNRSGACVISRGLRAQQMIIDADKNRFDIYRTADGDPVSPSQQSLTYYIGLFQRHWRKYRGYRVRRVQSLFQRERIGRFQRG
jgi:hypothetical protein